MSNHCVQCGSSIPDGQRTCSMCYGDIDHGRDGYYRDYMERWEQDTREKERQQEEDEGREL